MSQAPSDSMLLRLPADVHKLIITAFNAPVPLFTPVYEASVISDEENKNTISFGNLSNKHKEYYGTPSEDALLSSTALLNLSCTCRFYRDLLIPVLFQDIILRPRAKSMASVKLLSTSSCWQHVKSLTFVGSYVQERWHGNPAETEEIDPLEDLDDQTLSAILTNLPPNLKHLTLDFPTDWIHECNDDYLDVFDEEEPPEKTLELEAEDNWRKLIFTVLDAVVKNDWSSKDSFELKLLSIPPLPCSVYWSAEFHQLLNHVSHFTLGLDHFDNAAGWNMNTMTMPVYFCSRLPEWFWDHLGVVRSLKIHADKSWPIGLAPGRCHVPLALPQEDVRFTKLEKLDLKWWLVDKELITLLTKFMPKLEHLTMTKYYATSQPDSSSESDSPPTWAAFFDALQTHPTLKQLDFFPHLSGMKILNPYGHVQEPLSDSNSDPHFRKAWDEVKAFEEAKKGKIEAGTWDEARETRTKRLWPHCSLDDKYGMIFCAEEYCAERYTDEKDHEAWLRLCDAMEERGGACTIVDVPEDEDEGETGADANGDGDSDLE